jgi:hypothetical protein
VNLAVLLLFKLVAEPTFKAFPIPRNLHYRETIRKNKEYPIEDQSGKGRISPMRG